MIYDDFLQRICIYLEKYYQMSDGDEMQQLRVDIDCFEELCKRLKRLYKG